LLTVFSVLPSKVATALAPIGRESAKRAYKVVKSVSRAAYKVVESVPRAASKVVRSVVRAANGKRRRTHC
jgi:predicted CoA-binding protein